MNALYSPKEGEQPAPIVMHFDTEDLDEAAPIQVKVSARVFYSHSEEETTKRIFPPAFIAAVGNRLAESSECLDASKAVPYTEVSLRYFCNLSTGGDKRKRNHRGDAQAEY